MFVLVINDFTELFGTQEPDRAPGLALRIDARQSSAVALSVHYVGLYRMIGLVVSCRRSGSDRDIEIMVLRHPTDPCFDALGHGG
jgi:hypothetical protein